jgi:flagellar biosynthesis protein FliQ
MSPSDIGALMHDCMIVTIKLCLPTLGIALVVGLLISFLQAITQINESSLAFLPKILAISLALMLLGSSMSETLIGFTHRVFDRIVTVGGL